MPSSKMSTQARQVGEAFRNPQYCVQKVLDAFFRKNTVYKVFVDQESLTSFSRFYNCNFSLSFKIKVFFIVS